MDSDHAVLSVSFWRVHRKVKSCMKPRWHIWFNTVYGIVPFYCKLEIFEMRLHEPGDLNKFYHRSEFLTESQNLSLGDHKHGNWIPLGKPKAKWYWVHKCQEKLGLVVGHSNSGTWLYHWYPSRRITLPRILSLTWRSFMSTLVCQNGWCLEAAGDQLLLCLMLRNILMWWRQ